MMCENNVKLNSVEAVGEVTVCTSILGKNVFLIDHLKKGIAFIVHKVKLHLLYTKLSAFAMTIFLKIGGGRKE